MEENKLNQAELDEKQLKEVDGGIREVPKPRRTSLFV